MAEVARTGPFDAERPEDVPLVGAPLARVLAQVRFPRLSALAGSSDVANAYAAEMRADYPIMEELREVGVTVTPDGVTQTPGDGRLWRLRTADEKWQVSFGPNFLSLDTGSYVGRDDFCQRLDAVLRHFVKVVAPPFAERVGVRYINQIVDPHLLGDLSKLVRDEVLGVSSLSLPKGVQLGQSITESLYKIDENDGLIARWGSLPANVQLDVTLAAASEASWVLDLDSFRTGRFVVDDASLMDCVKELTVRAYRYFVWAVTADYIDRFRRRNEG